MSERVCAVCAADGATVCSCDKPMTSPAIPSPKGEMLKPCPLCGAPALLEHDSDHHGEWFNLGCSQHYEHAPDDPCPMGRLFYTESREDEAAAIKKWNRRSTSSREEVRREALEEAAKIAEERHKYWRMPHPDDAKPDEVSCDVTACSAIAKAIRALSQGE